jgi:hypothetical protein
MADEDFTEGFMFALRVVDSLGDRHDFDSIVAQLLAVAKGELSLQPSPEEAIRNIEADVGRPMPDVLKRSVHRMQASRHEADATNRGFALRMLSQMDIDPDSPPPLRRRA